MSQKSPNPKENHSIDSQRGGDPWRWTGPKKSCCVKNWRRGENTRVGLNLQRNNPPGTAGGLNRRGKLLTEGEWKSVRPKNYGVIFQNTGGSAGMAKLITTKLARIPGRGPLTRKAHQRKKEKEKKGANHTRNQGDNASNA